MCCDNERKVRIGMRRVAPMDDGGIRNGSGTARLHIERLHQAIGRVSVRPWAERHECDRQLHRLSSCTRPRQLQQPADSLVGDLEHPSVPTDAGGSKSKRGNDVPHVQEGVAKASRTISVGMRIRHDGQPHENNRHATRRCEWPAGRESMCYVVVAVYSGMDSPERTWEQNMNSDCLEVAARRREPQWSSLVLGCASRGDAAGEPENVAECLNPLTRRVGGPASKWTAIEGHRREQTRRVLVASRCRRNRPGVSAPVGGVGT